MAVIDTYAPSISQHDSPVNALLKRYESAKAVKDQWKGTFEECYEFALPQKESFYDETQGRRRTDRIFDETAVVGIQEFASRLQSGIVPNFSRWAEFRAGNEIPKEDKKEVDLLLDEVTEYVFELLQNSNFSQEVHESFLDIALGTAVLLVEEGDAVNPIVFKSIPLPQVYLSSGYDDKVDHVFRERQIRAKDMLIAYPDGELSEDMKRDMIENPEKMCEIIEVVYKNHANTKDDEYHYCAISPEHEHKIYEEVYKGLGANPFIVYRWSKSSGETYGRGPLMNALPAIKTANLLIEMVLENAQMSISGMYQVEDDGVVNVDNISLIPGTIIPKAAGSSGLQPIPQAGNFNVSDLVLKDQRNNIKKALYNDMLGMPNQSTPMSATEVAERQADLSRQIGAAFGRLQAELVTPVLQRVVYILKKQGRIKIPKVNGREIKVTSSSPLAQAQYQQDVATVDRFLAMIQGRVGPELTNLIVDQMKVAKYVAKKLGVPEELVRSEEEMQAAAQQMQQMMAQQQQSTEPQGE
ncbi:Head-tail connector protein [uncultured Mediterranean phage uvMED]|nr:Head-tail connector protein [uncultured Mediterranean phage uvMED]